jgi:hypothetical protein
MDALRRCLRSIGVDSITGAMNIRVTLPSLITSLGTYAHLIPANPIIAGTGALAFSLLPIIREKRKTARDVIQSSPEAYLLYLKEGLEPSKLTTWITQSTRELFLGV